MKYFGLSLLVLVASLCCGGGGGGGVNDAAPGAAEGIWTGAIQIGGGATANGFAISSGNGWVGVYTLDGYALQESFNPSSASLSGNMYCKPGSQWSSGQTVAPISGTASLAAGGPLEESVSGGGETLKLTFSADGGSTALSASLSDLAGSYSSGGMPSTGDSVGVSLDANGNLTVSGGLSGGSGTGKAVQVNGRNLFSVNFTFNWGGGGVPYAGYLVLVPANGSSKGAVVLIAFADGHPAICGECLRG